MNIFFVCMFLTFFSSTQSATFQCQYTTGSWGTLGSVYYCNVQNIVNISSIEAATADSITGTHQSSNNNDNVEVFSVSQGQINYFPRGLNKIFKNIRGILIASTGLKEIHQSDLKDFPKLMNLYLYSSNIEILEENLFEFNPHLENIYMISNKITHIDPKVFEKLIKLKSLFLSSNTCINMNADNNPTAVQNIIKTAQTSCTNLEYSNFELKVEYLEFQSKVLDSIDLNAAVEDLHSEIQNSKFPNFFHEKIAALYALAIQKELQDGLDIKLTDIEEMVANINKNNNTNVMSNKYNINVNLS